MNFPVPESVLVRQRCRPWIPLLTQQLRLRHVYQIIGYNITSQKQGSFYYTLHLTSMCAPFYTSEKVKNTHPKWAELDIKNLPSLAPSAFVLRVWQEHESEMDVVILTWGVNLSGLVYLGNKLSSIQPMFFNPNTVIFHMRGGYFTSPNTLRTDLPKPLPFIDDLNIISDENNTKVYRNLFVQVDSSDVKNSYNVKKLQRLHQLQIVIRNKNMDVEIVRDKINVINGVRGDGDAPQSVAGNSSQQTNIRYAPQLLTMNSLNKMLKVRSSREQRQDIQRLSKEIELARFRTKLLASEKDKKSAHLRHLKQKYNTLVDENEDRNSKLMESYHNLSRDTEKLREWRKTMLQHKEVLSHCSYQLHHRRRQLMQELLFLYPIQQVNEKKYIINSVYLPNSDILQDCSDGGLAVALGYVTHLLTMCSIFLQVPLRYPVTHYGSRSHIMDHISPSLLDKERDFPLFTKDRMQFNYAVYLLNKNIAQLRLLCGLHTSDLKATLPNLQGLLQGKPPQEEHHRQTESAEKESIQSLAIFGASSSGIQDPVLDSLKNECYLEQKCAMGQRYMRRTSKNRQNDHGPSLSEILAVPEAFLNQEISSRCMKEYIVYEKNRGQYTQQAFGASTTLDIEEHENSYVEDTATSCPESESIEQGTDLLSMPLDSSNGININNTRQATDSHRLSRSVGSVVEGEPAFSKSGLELGSDPSICKRDATELPSSLEEGQYVRSWLEGQEEKKENGKDEALAVRADALLSTTSFNLIKPKPQ